VGHSFGGPLSVLMAARDTGIRAAVTFGGAAGSWTQSAVLRKRLLSSVGRMSAPAFFIQAENDWGRQRFPVNARKLCSLTILSVCQTADFYFALDDNSDALATTALAA
jgi:pimeloyl-ACP methyl ester carboxylesterase